MTLWTNSQCVLDWLKQKQNENVFVKYPVDEIIKEDDVTLPLHDNPTNSQNNNNRFEDESIVVAWTWKEDHIRSTNITNASTKCHYRNWKCSEQSTTCLRWQRCRRWNHQTRIHFTEFFKILTKMSILITIHITRIRGWQLLKNYWKPVRKRIDTWSKFGEYGKSNIF